MVIEAFRPGCKDRVYERFFDKGRMLPAGLTYVDGWLEKDVDRCFQLMTAEHPALFNQWTRLWEDLVEFEIIEAGNEKE
jgi:hypothetical protein